MGFGRWTVCTILFALIETLFLCATVVAAQNDSLPSTPPVAIATKVEKAPDLDGEVLEDPAWASAKPASRFWQNAPDEGQPASERTEVRVIYTLDTIYFGVVCYDRDPDSIIVTDSLRDSSLDDTDSFQIIEDTYLDRQKEGSFLREEEIESVQVDLLFVHLHLSEIGVVGQIQRQAGCDAVLEVRSHISQPVRIAG